MQVPPARAPPGRIFQTFGRATRRLEYPYNPPLGQGILRGLPAFIMLVLLVALFLTSDYFLQRGLRFGATTTGGGGPATHPPPPPTLHQSRYLPASKCALKALQWTLATFKGEGVRFGSGRAFRISPLGRGLHSASLDRCAQASVV